MINADPLFIGAADYRLATGSPSIDTGNPALGGLIDETAPKISAIGIA